MGKDKNKSNIEFNQLLEYIKAGKITSTLMCGCAFGDTDDELILMAKRIKLLVRAGAEVTVVSQKLQASKE